MIKLLRAYIFKSGPMPTPMEIAFCNEEELKNTVILMKKKNENKSILYPGTNTHLKSSVDSLFILRNVFSKHSTRSS